MKRSYDSLWFLILPAMVVMMAGRLDAQDVDFGAFGDAGSLLTPSAPASRGAATAAPGRGALPAPPPPDRLVRLRDVLSKAEVPMTKEQEVELTKMMDAEIPVMRRTIQTHGQQMMIAAQTAAAGAAGAPSPAPLTAGGPRGASPSARIPAEVLDALEVEMRQMNDVLFGRIAASPALNARQQSVLVKMSRDQIRSRGGFDALRISMEDAGTPFSDDQLPKVQALFEDQKKTRESMARDTQATPDPAKLKQLERDTLSKVVGLLVPAQRTALLALLRAQ